MVFALTVESTKYGAYVSWPMNNPSESLRIHRALMTIARILDQLEDVPEDVKNRPQFRSRAQLIDDILNGLEPPA